MALKMTIFKSNPFFNNKNYVNIYVMAKEQRKRADKEISGSLLHLSPLTF
jgi:hypothetical protein